MVNGYMILFGWDKIAVNKAKFRTLLLQMGLSLINMEQSKTNLKQILTNSIGTTTILNVVARMLICALYDSRNM